MLHLHYNNLKNAFLRFSLRDRMRIGCVLGLALSFSSIGRNSVCHAKDGGWDLEPYQVQIIIAIDVPGGLAEQLANDLPGYIRRRFEASLYPALAANVRAAAGAERAEIFATLAAADPQPPDLQKGKDKLLLAAVRTGPDGIRLTAREFDRYVQHWSTLLHRESRQESYLPEQLFSLIHETFSPLAQIELDPKDPHRVVLKPRAALLPRSAGAAPLAKPGDIFLPILRRTTRGGEVEKKDGLQTVPWTYIEATELKDNTVVSRLQSARRGPIVVRRQGRIEPVAIAVHADPDSITLRLHSRSSANKPLVGYEVFSQRPGEEASARIGNTDTAGQIPIPPGKTPLQFLLVKHGGQLFAKIPVVSGLRKKIDIPLPDDDTRLAAEASLAAVREDLVDVVARRNILMSRARQKIEKKDYAVAQELLRALDDLPNRTQFNLTLANASRSFRSDDPQMQKRIDKLFESTRTLLTQYLDLRPISKLHDELREAQNKSDKKGTSPSSASKG